MANGAITRLLVANRGEIAVRVMRAARQLGIASIAVYGAGEEQAVHVRSATDAYRLPPVRSGGPVVPYLDIEGLIAIARQAGADAVHPGYGFLSENADFARACEAAGLIFVGPPADAIAAMGDKVEARRVAVAAGVPVVPGTPDPVASLDEARTWADATGYPVAVKAAGGGGGRGFRVARAAGELERAFTESSGEAARFFANPAVYLERYVDQPRHVEIQVFADRHGNVVSLGERDCSVQRRHQKLIEESPSPAVGDALRREMGEASVRLAREVGYVGAGTVEFLLDAQGRFSFLEMNTRIQVEHPVTEWVTGIDLVREQLLVAAGEPLSFAGESIVPHGHAIECRINAEDPARDFAPAPGTVTTYREPGGFGVRVDAAAEPGLEILPDYDSMIAKLITWGRDRTEAVDRMAAALSEFEVGGVPTTIGLHRRIMAEVDFRGGTATTAYLPEHPAILAGDESVVQTPSEARDDPATPEHVLVEVNGRRMEVVVHGLSASVPASGGAVGRHAAPSVSRGRKASGGGPELVSTIQGTVVRIPVEVGQDVEAGQVGIVVSAMKMENELSLTTSGRIDAIHVAVGDAVRVGTPLISVRAAEQG
ncbi:MAG TPA: acetyl-CoA carboxylase biotin carboxylase subunit [Thermomicrobiales bacterium]|jgi:acetyl-CoA/propionyl-CoA carboxylase biotin carboxyl carrier protein|nr:acetyl-CoA carboxylase biotin carboxylase subunit [Thermomicrobiales bacterium]